jgi:hypothetical protein
VTTYGRGEYSSSDEEDEDVSKAPLYPGVCTFLYVCMLNKPQSHIRDILNKHQYHIRDKNNELTLRNIVIK